MKLFNLFNKNKVNVEPVSIINQIDTKGLNWVFECVELQDGYSRINWEKVANTLEANYQYGDEPELINDISRVWLEQLSTELAEKNKRYESENFMVLTSETDKYVKLFLKFLERSHNTILRTLKGVARTNHLGKFVIIIIDDIDEYYSYISHYYPEDGEFAMSSGVFLSAGHGYFVFPNQGLNEAEAVAAHELTHAMLKHLPIPLWLNEGLAVNMEQAITRFPQFRLTQEKHIKHERFWQEKEIQEFWAGVSFSRPDDGNELSYQLAQLIVLSLSEEYDSFVEFVNKANFSDGGEAAALEVYGGSIGAVIYQFFGEGDWSPSPSEWTVIEGESES